MNTDSSGIASIGYSYLKSLPIMPTKFKLIESLSSGASYVEKLEGVSQVHVSSSGKFKTILKLNGNIIRVGFGDHSVDSMGIDSSSVRELTLVVLNRDSVAADLYISYVEET